MCGLEVDHIQLSVDASISDQISFTELAIFYASRTVIAALIDTGIAGEQRGVETMRRLRKVGPGQLLAAPSDAPCANCC